MFVLFQDMGYSNTMYGIGQFLIVMQLLPTLVYIYWHWETPDNYHVYNKNLDSGTQAKEFEMGWFTVPGSPVYEISGSKAPLQTVADRTGNCEFENLR